MKKFTLLLMGFLLALTGFAQTNNATFGPKLGISSSNVTIRDDVEGFDTGKRKIGFHAGAFARFSFGPLFVQPELLFTSTGAEVEVESVSAQQIREYEFNKLDLPVMIGLKLGESLRFFAGPMASLVLSSDVRQQGTTQEVRDNYKNATIGYQAGVGVDIGNLIIDLKYESNLSKFGDRVTVGSQEFATDTRNNQLILSLGVLLF